jgi:hypothetical protein
MPFLLVYEIFGPTVSFFALTLNFIKPRLFKSLNDINNKNDPVQQSYRYE